MLPFPFHFLDSNHAMNVRPLNYDWAEFYAYAEDLSLYAHSPQRMLRRFTANRGLMTKGMNFVPRPFLGPREVSGKDPPDAGRAAGGARLLRRRDR